MPTSVTCPDCDARLTLRTTPVAGARLKCPKCATQFTYMDSSDAETSASKKSSISAPKKSTNSADSQARRQRDQDEDDESERPGGRSAASSDEEDEERRPRKKKKAKTGSKTGLIIGLAVGAGGLVVLGIVAVGVVLYVMREKPGVVQQQANGDPPGQVVNNQAAPPQPVKDQVGKDGKPKDAGPVVFPVPQPPKKVNPAELYGDQGGEQVAAANAGLPSTLMRARRDDTFFKLSNPREAEVKGPDAKGKGNSTVREALLIDYVVVRRGKFDGGILVIHTDDGQRAEVALNLLAGRDQGTIQLVGVTSVGFFKKQQINSKTEFPKNAEFYVTRGDDRYLPPSKFMVSNSAVMGVMKVTSRARDWTAEEIDRYGKPPPAYRSPNLQPATLGDDVPALNGWPWKNRYVEPEGRLLGLEYNLGEWAKVKRIGGLVPVFSHDQPPSLPSRELARPGYAVAGAEVNFDKDGIVFGIRLLFRRVKTDNNLDAADAYAGQWIGTPPTGAPTVLANDGRRVMGMSSQNGAVVDRFALVVAR